MQSELMILEIFYRDVRQQQQQRQVQQYGKPARPPGEDEHATAKPRVVAQADARERGHEGDHQQLRDQGRQERRQQIQLADAQPGDPASPQPAADESAAAAAATTAATAATSATAAAAATTTTTTTVVAATDAEQQPEPGGRGGLDDGADGTPGPQATHAPQGHVAEPGSRGAPDRDVGARAQPVPLRVHLGGRVPVHRVRQGRHPEDLQEQVQLPETRVPLPRGPPAQGLPLPGLPEGVLPPRQDEEPHEDRARLLHAQGVRHAVLRLLPPALGCARPLPPGGCMVGPRPRGFQFDLLFSPSLCF